jgi:hypothetical protein
VRWIWSASPAASGLALGGWISRGLSPRGAVLAWIGAGVCVLLPLCSSRVFLFIFSFPVCCFYGSIGIRWVDDARVWRRLTDSLAPGFEPVWFVSSNKICVFCFIQVLEIVFSPLICKVSFCSKSYCYALIFGVW